MSRSYKKNQIYKDYNKGSKKLSHRKFRRKSKQILDEEDKLSFKQSEVMNPYDISDWKIICNDDCYCLRTFGIKKCIMK